MFEKILSAIGGVLSGFADWLNKVIGVTNDALYSYILIIVLLVGGLYFTIRTKCVQFRLIKEQFRSVTEKPADGKGVSSFQALMVSTASRVGTGNIIGVSTALCLGGFGSVFWMWVIAIIGAATAFIESTLAQIYKKRNPDGSCYGGPAYYIETALKSRVLAVVFSVLLVLTYGVGFNMLASYNLQSTFSAYSFYNESITPWIIGLVLAVLVGFCLFGGGKRIIKATTFIVPFMGLGYIIIALVITILNVTSLPSIFRDIFVGAFDFKAIFGGFAGSCVIFGIKRGLFSNEAGVGSAPNASASAQVAHPVKQGLVQVLSVFIDTLLVCSATAFMCMASGVTPSPEIAGAQYIQEAVSVTLGKFGPIFITVAMILFAFTTLLGNLFYVDKSLAHLLKRQPSKRFNTFYYIIASLLILAGAGLSSDLLWGIADVTMGGMTLINIPVIIILGKYAFRALDDYTRQRKMGIEPVFKAKDIDLPHKTDYWN
ncbi:MAG: alanine:cation symporter family protein [Clostridia bacterium]|nr:alanine:cation symporter family protein [Clostridia bacterium]